MAYTETTKVSYGKRVGNSFRGIFTGFLLIIAGTILLWWNEGRAVKEAKMLSSASRACVHVESVEAVDPKLDGKLIHANAYAKCDETLVDPTFGVSVVAAHLHRNVEYYQWVEHSSSVTKDKIGGGQETVTTYTYEKQWTSSPVDSDSFKDPEARSGKRNTALMSARSDSYSATKVAFGGYVLPRNLISSIPCNTPVDIQINQAQRDEWNRGIAALKNQGYGYGYYGYGAPDYVHVSGNTIYFGTSSASPEIGDVRVTFTKSLDGDASVIAVVDGNSFKPFEHKNGHSICTLSMGTRTMDEMFEAKEKSNKIMLWVLRILGILVVIGGFKGIFDFLVTILKVIPALAKVANAGVSLVCNVVGLSWSLIIILIAWFAYRPLLAAALLGAVVALFYFLITKSKNAPEQPAEEVQPAE